MPAEWKMAREYFNHVKNGGDRIDPEKLNPTSTKLEKGAILKKLDEKGIRLGSR